jgi:superfamily II DNA or RNA helicase
LCYATGVGKTRTACIAIQTLLKQKNDATVLVCVPTEVLKQQ